MKTSAELIETCNRLFSGVSEFSDSSTKILISYFGQFNQGNLNQLLYQTEEHLKVLNESKKTSKRVFSIVVEGLQNILTHGQMTEDQHRLGFYTLSYKKGSYKIYFGNLIDIVDVVRVEKELEKINAMDIKTLKDYHREVLVYGSISEKGGAGLGLIITRMKTSNDIKFDYSKLSEDLFFCSFEALVETPTV